MSSTSTRSEYEHVDMGHGDCEICGNPEGDLVTLLDVADAGTRLVDKKLRALVWEANDAAHVIAGRFRTQSEWRYLRAFADTPPQMGDLELVPNILELQSRLRDVLARWDR